ncbi:MAG TPA: phosphoadenylyl-sulfate reductase [Actinomycetota bacterium]|jgi:phosphoadenosine phosphosulfate reductase|nr:phosphoadenylyl-sulfate reductase [Actinomycetota bacterium]
MPRLDPAEVGEAARRLEHASAGDVLAWGLGTFGKRCAIVTSFQVEGLVMLDLARQVDPGVRVITIDTGRLPEETHELIDTVRARFDIEVEVITPDGATLEAMVSRHGPNLFRRDRALRKLCCHVRKVEPLRRALEDLDAWVSGLRRDGGPARVGTAKVELDQAHGGVVKLNPLADWTRERAMEHARTRNLPLHPLYEQGFTSIGCAPCTRAPQPGESERAGRWWWEADEDRECGLHQLTPSMRLDAAMAELDAGAALQRRLPA